MSQLINQLESLGRYKLIRELGRGGMSVVYLAQDTELGREVAIKCVDTSEPTAARMANSLRAEAKLLAQLNHPNIVQLYDVVEQENILGLVIEYVGGDTLTQRLKQAPSREVTLKWLAEIAEGLASAHKKGIAHCDLKADNVLVTNDNIAKVADFGIAKVKLDGYLEDDGLTRIDSVSGSYFSLSPEQASGQAVDTRTDLFSLAVLIHQALVSQHPFGDTHNKMALLQRVINDPLELSESANITFGSRLAELVKNLLSKKPEERLYNAAETAELLRSEALNVSTNDLDDSTGAIPTQAARFTSQTKPTSQSKLLKKAKGLLGKAVLIASGFAVGVVLLKLLPSADEAVSDVTYIALDNIEVTASDGFNKTLLPLIKSTIQQSTESTLLSFKHTGLVEAKELNAIDGAFSEKAIAAGVDNIMVVSANCLQQKCDIKIQRRSGERMAVSHQTSFPVASDSLIGLKNAISSQLPKLFQNSILSRSQSAIELSEDDYRRYLQIYTSSASGTLANQKHFDDIQKLILDKPNFIPSYTLLYHLGGYLYRNTSNSEYLTTVLGIFERSPNKVKLNRTMQRAKINLLLDMGRVSDAKTIFSSLKSRDNDELFLNEIESSVAYAENDYEKLLVLDRQNASWRPSARNLYNLAASEFFYGDIERSQVNVGKSLELRPNFTYALNLKATLELSTGNVEEAIKAYESVLERDADNEAYSNYGVALTLNKRYKDAIDSLLKAIEINPKAAHHYLNLADAYNLSGKKELAKKNYDKVVAMIVPPESARDYSYLAQAQAQTGMLNLAVRTLKTANQKYPEYAELDYASAIVNTLAENYVSAIVDINDSIQRGTAPVWFTFEWFHPLCAKKEFLHTTGAANTKLCL